MVAWVLKSRVTTERDGKSFGRKCSDKNRGGKKILIKSTERPRGGGKKHSTGVRGRGLIEQSGGDDESTANSVKGRRERTFPRSRRLRNLPG